MWIGAWTVASAVAQTRADYAANLLEALEVGSADMVDGMLLSGISTMAGDQPLFLPLGCAQAVGALARSRTEPAPLAALQGALEQCPSPCGARPARCMPATPPGWASLADTLPRPERTLLERMLLVATRTAGGVGDERQGRLWARVIGAAVLGRGKADPTWPTTTRVVGGDGFEAGALRRAVEPVFAAAERCVATEAEFPGADLQALGAHAEVLVVVEKEAAEAHLIRRDGAVAGACLVEAARGAAFPGPASTAAGLVLTWVRAIPAQ